MAMALVLATAPLTLKGQGQERGATALGEAVTGLGVSARVLMVGAHPDDEDTFLITWLSRGRGVETAYLSLTRGDGGQNIIGNELGEALGVIRTEELFAARRIDGARQFFTRAYDFGFSKDTTDTYAHWPKDSVLGDVVRVVRAFRPHVIVPVFSGTSRDGHGQHQVSGLLAREAFDAAADTARFPAATHGRPWQPLKLYQSVRGNATAGTIGFDAGEYSPLLGRSYSEIAGESRSQHKSQGFGALQLKGPITLYLRRETTRVNAGTAPGAERSIFDGVDTTWRRFSGSVNSAAGRRALDSLPRAIAAARRAYDPFAPEKLKGPLERVLHLLHTIREDVCGVPSDTRQCVVTDARIENGVARVVRAPRNSDLDASLTVAERRVIKAMRLASGIAIDATAERELQPLNKAFRVFVAIYNRGTDTVQMSHGSVHYGSDAVNVSAPTRRLPPGAVLHDTLIARFDSMSQPWWLGRGRTGALFTAPALVGLEERKVDPVVVYATSDPLGLEIREPIVYRFADDVRGEVRRRVAGAPAVSVTLDHPVQYAAADAVFERDLNVLVHSADPQPRAVVVTLSLPPGLSPDSVSRAARLEGYGASHTLTFRVRGRLPAGQHRIGASAESAGERYEKGFRLVDYEHISRHRIYQPAEVLISAVPVRVPAALRVAYIPGVGDNVTPMLAQLGVPVTVLTPRDAARLDLTRFTTVVIGPRAYEAHPDLAAANSRLFDFARNGGTLVVQYGQYEMMRPGMMPYQIAIARPHTRVTHEDAPVAILNRAATVMNWPNRIDPADFSGWVQERALYMPRSFDEAFQPVLGMSDPGEPENRGAILVAPLGRGLYIYTSLAFFRQLPAGVPGGARLFVNLLSAGLDPETSRD